MTKLAIVTGSSGGIGAATCAALAASGFHCAGIDRAPPATATSRSFYACDLADLAALADVAASIRAKEGVPDLLVNNAGVNKTKPLLSTSVDEYEHTMAVNARAPFFLTQHIARQMIEAGVKGAIVNVVSIAAFRQPFDVSYGMSKAALMQMTRSLGIELGKHGIRVNAVAPGVIDTPMTSGLSAQDQAAFAAQVPLGRIGAPEEVARAIAFLASDNASFVNGNVVHVNGGMF